MVWSNHGDSSLSGAGSAGPSKINIAHNIWVHVVPHFDGVLITMSEGLNSKPSHLALSLMSDRYSTFIDLHSHGRHLSCQPPRHSEAALLHPCTQRAAL